MKAEDIFNKPLTKKQKMMLHKLESIPDSDIDTSDIPPLTEQQLANAYRPRDRQLISVRLDLDVLTWLKSYGEGYSTRLNNILRTVMEQRYNPPT